MKIGVVLRIEQKFHTETFPSANTRSELKARNSEGLWSNQLKYSFSITPPWWKTYWFRSLEVIFILLIFSLSTL